MYSQEWLESPTATKAIFIEAYYRDQSTGTDTPVYMSTAGYLLKDSSISFDPIVKAGVSLNESINQESNVSLSFGDIELININGALDSWLNPAQRVWVNRPIKIYFGDPFWSVDSLATFRTTFKLIFDGLISDIDSKNRNTINIKLVDKLQRLNGPITEDKIGDLKTSGAWPGQTNQDEIIPLVFGEVFNFEPMLVSANLDYRFNNGESESLIEIRDNGVPIYTPGQGLTTGATVSLSSSTFQLKQSLAGTCTVSVQGIKKSATFSPSFSISSTYTNNIARIIAVIVTQYGKESTRFTSNDIDLFNFNSFATGNTQPVGIVITDRSNVLNVCQELSASIGAQMYVNRIGKLQLLRFGTPTSAANVSITDSDILFDSLTLSQRLDVIGATKIGFCKNWNVQDNLLTGIPEEHKQIFAREFKTVTNINTSTINTYRLEKDVEQVDTLLLTTTDATAEATRRTNLFSEQKVIYKFIGTSRLLSLELGQPVTLTHHRFNLQNGVSGQVVSLSPNWIASTVDVEVLV